MNNVDYKQFVKLKFKILKISLNKKKFKIKILAYIINKDKIDIKDMKFFVDGNLNKKCNLKQYKKDISKMQILKDKNIYKFSFDLNDIAKDSSKINGYLRFELNIDGTKVQYRVGIKNEKLKNKRYYKIPLKSAYVGDYSIHIRRTMSGNLVLVKREKEDIEKSLRYRALESKFVSCILYYAGKIFGKFRKKKINLFYEKFASKAEEGVYDLCKLCQKSKNTKNYFIIDKNTNDYEEIKKDKNVVAKYSLKYYWLFYNTNCFISSEVPGHLNILRSNNKYLRRAIYDKKFVFLQHGIIYMKNLEVNSIFKKGEEGEADYIVVSSEKEKNVVKNKLGYDDKQILKTGITIYSKIKYNHINQNSADYVSVMLTWKPYEEQMYSNFEDSSYYKNAIKVFNVLKNYINHDKIIIVGHPKANNLLNKTDLADYVWKEPISKALEKTKLLITDYSSVCYNTFYQGGGVIFYQPDLELYEAENGKLIPTDDEYIGRRTFNIDELEDLLKKCVQNQKINLDKLREEKYVENYKLINEFSDGKNIDRIYNELIRLGFI